MSFYNPATMHYYRKMQALEEQRKCNLKPNTENMEMRGENDTATHPQSSHPINTETIMSGNSPALLVSSATREEFATIS